MSLKEKVRHKFEDAKRAGNREEKNLLSVILGDISTSEARSGKEVAGVVMSVQKDLHTLAQGVVAAAHLVQEGGTLRRGLFQGQMKQGFFGHCDAPKGTAGRRYLH